MHRLILVEDEEDVREGIVKEIEWSNYGFEVVETAENGKEAIEAVEKWLPDLVITDIRMPFMDGLQLSAWLRDNYPTTRIIILTGFDEFEYAQKAIHLHIDAYVLKPFPAQELIDVLIKLNHTIVEEAELKRNMHTLREHYHQSLPVLREVFLSSLIRRKQPISIIQEKCMNYGIDLSGEAFKTAVVSIDEPLSNYKDMELMTFAVLNMTEELLKKYGRGITFLHSGQVVMIMIETIPGQWSANKMLEELRQSVIRFLKLSVTIGIGTECRNVTDLSYSYRDAVQALDYRLILGGDKLIAIDDVEKRFAEKLRFDELKEHALIRCLKVGTAEEIREAVDMLFGDFADSQFSVKDYQIYLLEVLTTILRVGKDARADMDSILGAEFMPLAELQRFTSLAESKEWVLSVCTRLMENIASERQCTYKSLVQQAKEYVLNRYHESDLSINRICGHLHISTGYFSSIFKKETKMTFGAYLTHIRMEAAKELLRATDLKAFEIAERVGYAESNYFSFSFRKYVGVSPKEYRQGAAVKEL